MKAHLTSEQLDGLLCGQTQEAAALHLESCERCAAEFNVLRSTLGDLRMTTAAAAEHHHRFAPTSRQVPGMAWALGAVLLAVSVVTPLAVHRREVARAAAEHTALVKPAVSDDGRLDDALLNDVRNDLSSSVPDSLLPLTATGASTTQSTTKE